MLRVAIANTASTRITTVIELTTEAVVLADRLSVLGRTRSPKWQATSAIVVSYYWHFVDVVWIGLFATIYLIR